ncbi:asparagine synthase (glutamine-hydrolyzing) [Amphibacillus xylanus]|uniref:asparagine synthase (glutamine-hydrolyzing) n=1 Tax=Amphibacillus xylanus (strain ATCC 51415 / DSM 6626 / JCM 7361 / LMG 17667 / NBRC 15112 / Ep01) TaxID=698758 RepID=K0J6Z2_AMPXN|nr:asparagine synthase (glutamine-hydrolyzing) [Amphibacillus xylanus]BAM46988.1 putative asparagine synthetase [Amphibacillus xylanus NBRC 15112]
MSDFFVVLQLSSLISSEESQDDTSQSSQQMQNLGPISDPFFQNKYVKFAMPQSCGVNQEQTNQFYVSNDKSFAVIFTGQIDNAIELRKHLQESGYVFNSNSVSEMLLHLFVEYKARAFKKLRGRFAIAVWSQEEKTVYAARDRLGLQPLYYHITNESLYISSSKKLLNDNTSNTQLNRQALQYYFNFQYVPEPFTLDKRVNRLEAGHYLFHKYDEQVQIHRYWQPSFSHLFLQQDQWVKRIQDSLIESVSKQMKSDQRIGAFLSGGIDSSFIVSIAKQINPSIKTFSVGFEQEGFSEVDIAKQTAAELGIENYAKIITAEEYIKNLPQIIAQMDDPLADPSCVPLYFVAQEARKHVEVALSGEGADELFGGYRIYREPLSLKVFDYIPTKMKEMLHRLAQMMPEGVKGKSYLERGTIPLKDRYIGNAKMFENDELNSVLMHHDPNITYQQITEPLYQDVSTLHPVEQMQYVDLHTWLRGDILMKANQMLASHALELRTPFLADRVIDLAMGIPVNLKIAKGTTKYILREAAKGIVPEHVIDRKKLGFPVPIRHWLKNEMYDWAKQVINESETDELINKAYFIKLLDLHRQGKNDYSRKIWTAIIFMIWHRIFVKDDQIDHQLDEKRKIS